MYAWHVKDKEEKMSRKVLRFTAPWCAPCKALANIIETIENVPEIEVIDITQDKDAAVKYRVQTVPTMVLLEGPVELKRFRGIRSKSLIEEWLK